ncbi:MAG TPA: VC0807 family protein [Herpetosiphonaceae bacterium]|nr:VC0807 family protein [Herpetosiphonaceae bacterium]
MDSPPNARQPGRPAWLRPGLVWFAFDLLAPTALIYALLWLGASLYLALLGSAALSAASGLVAYRRGAGNRGFALPMLGLALLGFGVALLSGSERFLLAKESILTAMVGLWFLGSLWSARPLTYVLTRPLLEGRLHRKRRSWEALWTGDPRFRRIWRVSTVMWTVALLIDAVLRVVLAYALPVRLVPAMQTGLLIATALLMQFVTNGYYIRAGLWRMLHEEPAA